MTTTTHCPQCDRTATGQARIRCRHCGHEWPLSATKTIPSSPPTPAGRNPASGGGPSCGVGPSCPLAGVRARLRRIGVGLKQVDTALGSIRHWIAGALTVVVWMRAEQPAVGIIALMTLPFVAAAAAGLLTGRFHPATPSARHIEVRTHLLAAGFAVVCEVGVIIVPGLGWIRLPILAALAFAAIGELHDGLAR